MKTYTFVTKISESGTIQIPFNPDLFDKEVEITIVSKKQENKVRGNKAMSFVKKWAGFLKNPDTEDAKYAYLKDKHK